MMIRRATGKIESYTKESGEEAINIRIGKELVENTVTAEEILEELEEDLIIDKETTE